MTKNCANCNSPLDENDDKNKVHIMTHWLMDQLNKMPSHYGSIAMIQLLVANTHMPKDKFMKMIDATWNQWAEKQKW
jgi:hypothetical protein